jgi:hypothetical protein
MAKFRTLVIVTTAITLMAGCAKSPLLGKWRVAGGQTCQTLSGYEFTSTDATYLLNNGSRVTVPVSSYSQDGSGTNYSVNLKNGQTYMFQLEGAGISQGVDCHFVRAD